MVEMARPWAVWRWRLTSYRIHAKCLDGGDAQIRQRVQAALGHADADRNVDTRWTQILARSRT
jgi:adenylylsulfate kinase-like enzyme